VFVVFVVFYPTVNIDSTQSNNDLDKPAYLRQEKYLNIAQFIKDNNH